MNFFFSRRSLFLKIFLWFWLSFLAVNAVFIVVSLATDAELIPARSRTLAVKTEALAAAALFEQSSAKTVADYFQKTEAQTGIRGFLFDSFGVEVTGRNAPEAARQAFDTAQTADEIQFVSRETKIYSAVRVASANGRSVVFVGESPRFPDFSIFNVSPQTRIWRITLTIGISGLICLWLASYLTAPIIKISRAARNFADGDLTARVGSEFEKRQDELADLSGDFDRMAEKIENLMRSQTRLLSDISHELRSPLARLNIALELAREGDDAVERTEAHDIIEREAVRLNNLIGQLLTLTKLENAGENKVFAPVNLTEIVREAAADADFEARRHQRGVSLLEVQECFVNGDVSLLRSAIENVLRNAIRYTAEQTTVEIGLRCEKIADGKQAAITIRDFGAGVPEAELDKIFQPFYRVAAARERETGGTGLGLAIASRAVQLHHGTISAENAGGKGLEVLIRLPLAEAL